MKTKLENNTRARAIYECEICKETALSTDDDPPGGWKEWFYELDMRMAHACPMCASDDDAEPLRDIEDDEKTLPNLDPEWVAGAKP